MPCRAILTNRHVGDSRGCPVCQNGAEDIKHLVFTRDRAREIWRSLGTWQTLQRYLESDRSGSIVIDDIIRLMISSEEMNRWKHLRWD